MLVLKSPDVWRILNFSHFQEAEGSYLFYSFL
jgi:hypothetical protein